jgi:crossover junction endodeoxyribonuclease RuvC
VSKSQRSIVAVFDMPLLAPKPTDPRRQLDIHKLASLVSIYSPHIDFAVVEDVHAMPGQGVVSMFRFGFTLGALLGVLHSSNITVFKVTPSVWKPEMGLSRDKSKSIELIKKIYPHNTDHFSLKKHDGRAEACLLATFGARRFHT